MKAIYSRNSILLAISCIIISLMGVDNTALNPYYKRCYPGPYSYWKLPEYRSDYDYYDPYVRRSSSVYVISDYNYYTTPFSYYYH